MLDIAVLRRFGGKTYVRGMVAHSTKAAARTLANKIRKRGRLARVVKVKAGYVVYQSRGSQNDAPRYKSFNGKTFTLSAATRFGVPKADAVANQEYLEGMGFRTRRVERGRGDYLVYGQKV